jgi:NADH:ubiquinone oxidoreductase subunit 4 (subunit M)
VTVLGVPLLSFLVFFPLAGGIALTQQPKGKERALRAVALGVSVIELLGTLVLKTG